MKPKENLNSISNDIARKANGIDHKLKDGIRPYLTYQLTMAGLQGLLKHESQGYGPCFVNVSLLMQKWIGEDEKNSKDSTGETLSLEMTLTPNLIAEIGIDDNNINGTDNFAKITFIYPPRETPTASTEFVSEKAFVQFDMSTELLSIVRRTNKQIIESEGSGVVMARSN